MEKVDRVSAAGGFQASRQRITTFLIIAIVLIGAFLVVLDWGKFAPVLAQADMNHVLTTGGVAGYSVRYLLMRKHGVSLKDVLAASILHLLLSSPLRHTLPPMGRAV